MTLTQFFTNIANEIRSVKGTTELIPATNFHTEIAALKAGGSDVSEYFSNDIYVGGLNDSALYKSIRKLPSMTLIGNSCKNLCRNCINLVEAPEIDTSNSVTFENMFYQCPELIIIPEYDAEKCTNVQLFISFHDTKLQNFGGLKNIGKAYTQKENNYQYYTINLSYTHKLTHESLMNIINNLYDLNLTYDVVNGGTLYTQQLILGATNKAKLTAAEIAIATQKGWIVS